MTMPLFKHRHAEAVLPVETSSSSRRNSLAASRASLEHHMATPQSTHPQEESGLLSSIVNAASSFVASKDLKSHPPSVRQSPSFVDHLEALLTTESKTEKKRPVTSPEPRHSTDMDMESVRSHRSIAADVVFQPLRNKPITTMGKGELTLQDLGFTDQTPTFERQVSFKAPKNEKFKSIEIVEPAPVLPSQGNGGGVTFPAGPSSPRLSYDSSTPPARLPGDRPISHVESEPFPRMRSRSTSPAVNRRSMSPISFAKRHNPDQQSLSLTTTLQSIDETHPPIIPGAFPSSKRQTEFHNLFPSLPATETLLDDFSCALQKDILVQGKMYLSQYHIAFNSNILGWTTNVIIPLKEVVQIEKKSVAGLFPNAISVRSLHQRYLFASLIARDTKFATIVRVWRQVVRGDREIEMDDDGDELQTYDSYDETSVESNNGSQITSDMDGTDRTGMTEDGFSEGGYDDDDADDFDVNKPDDDQVGQGANLNGDMGPLTHKPTSFEHTPAPAETKVCERLVAAPIGRVYQLMFGSDSSFLKNTLERQKNHDLSDFPPFTGQPKTRKYSYTKPLSAPVGPKETKCEVEEIIQHSDFETYVEVLQKTKTPDVPSGNSFVINTWIYLSWGQKNSTNICIFTNVEWSAKSWLKSAVEKGAISGQKESLNGLIDEMENTLSSGASPAEEEETSTGSTLPVIGPKTHAPTSIPFKAKNETQVLNETIPAPLGTVYLLLFDDSQTLNNILTKQKNYKISELPPFSDKKREYNYVKPINAPIGPKETKCNVTETIEFQDWEKYVFVKQSTITPDVPSGNAFSTVTSIYLSWGENNSTKIQVWTEVQWTGRSWIKGPIEKGAVDGQKESMGVLVSELKEIIANSKGGKKKKMKRGRSTTRTNVLKKEPEPEEKGWFGTINDIWTPIKDIIGIELPWYGALGGLFAFWLLLWVFWRVLFSRGAQHGSIKFTELNNVMINGEEFIIMPKIPKILTDEELKKATEYEIWEWIETRRGNVKPGKSQFAKDHDEQHLKYMVELAETHLKNFKRDLEEESSEVNSDSRDNLTSEGLDSKVNN